MSKEVKSDRTLVINPGSSSVKFRLYSGERVILDGVVDEIGKGAVIELKEEGEDVEIVSEIIESVKTHRDAAKLILEIVDKHKPQLISKVIYRVVHGGSLSSPSVVDDELMRQIRKLVPLAPLHMKNALSIIEFFIEKIKCKHVVCFDNAFHSSMPEGAWRYAIPNSISEKYSIRKYGFHGLAHQWLLGEAERKAGRKFGRAISCQLGNGASVCAMHYGRSIDTSMGFTPLEGLMMGTRSGDIDPALIAFLSEREKKSATKIVNMLEHESGLKGITGESNVRKLLERMKKGDEKAKLALAMFAYRVRKYIGAYMAALEGVDLIVLGGGVARAIPIRKKILEGLEEFGIHIDKIKVEKDGPVKISYGKVEVWILETDEQDMMFRLAEKL